MKRDDLLSTAWTGKPLELGGRELRLSAGRHGLLGYWKNAFFEEGQTGQSSLAAMGELVMVCYLTKDEVKGVQRMTNEDRAKAVVDFMLEFEDELPEIQAGIQERMEAIKAAIVESESPGKEGVPHAS